MKNLTLIIHTQAQQDIGDMLRSLPQVSGFTFSTAEGHGVQAENDPFLSARDKVVGYTPKMRVEVLLKDSDVDKVVNTLRNANIGIKNLAVYWVTAVEQTGRF